MKKNKSYDAMGQRIAKTVTNKNTTDGTDKFVTTYYVRNPQGNVLAVYEKKEDAAGAGQFQLKERHLYGMNRLGMVSQNVTLAQFDNSNVTNGADPTTPQAGDTHYELTNHLGNVMAVISDTTSATAEPTVVSLSDYYPFGMTMGGRSYSADEYRYGFQGQDRERELWGGEASFFTYRISDNRLGRFFSVDPLSSKFPWNSSYAFSENRVIDGVEMEGLEYLPVTDENIDPGSVTRDVNDNYNLTLGNTVFSNVKFYTSCDGQLYYDLGRHMYYSETSGWSTQGSRAEQKTIATRFGIELLAEEKERDTKGYGDYPGELSLSTKKTWAALSEDKKYSNYGQEAVCHAWVMYIMNDTYISRLGNSEDLLNCRIPDSGKNEDLRISGMCDGNLFGVAKAIANKNIADLFDDESFWNGAAQTGDPIQKLGKDNSEGHSMIFMDYMYDDGGKIIGYNFWDKLGYRTDYKAGIDAHEKKVRGGNLKDK